MVMGITLAVLARRAVGSLVWFANLCAFAGWITLIVAIVDKVPEMLEDHADGWVRTVASPTRLWRRVGTTATALEAWCALEVVRSMFGMLPKMNYTLGVLLHYTRL